MNAAFDMPTTKGVQEAVRRIARILPPTPLVPIEIGGRRAHAKLESLQPIGAFKIRGAWNRLVQLSGEERRAGVVAVSSGNHAQGVAWAARRLGIHATIVMPRDAPQVKLRATRALGARIVLYERASEDRDEVAARVIAERGGTLVHAFADKDVIEGQGTIGIEITAQLGREPQRIIAPCGGGGLSAGLALACPSARIVPVEPEGWDMVGEALRRGALVRVGEDRRPTICDALQPDASAPINLAVLKGRAQGSVVVSDEEVIAAQRFAFETLKLVLEPGGAAALAAALSGKVEIDEDSVIVLSGGNVDPEQFAHAIGVKGEGRGDTP